MNNMLQLTDTEINNVCIHINQDAHYTIQDILNSLSKEGLFPTHILSSYAGDWYMIDDIFIIISLSFRDNMYKIQSWYSHSNYISTLDQLFEYIENTTHKDALVLDEKFR